MTEEGGRDRPFGSVRKFNPGTLQSDRELVEQFVARNRELELLLEVLRGNINSPSCQHLLVVAPARPRQNHAARKGSRGIANQ